jgi:glycosyltransferase involved in cell wall biosynthesis
MKIGVVNRANRENNTGFTSFESGILPYLLEDERFESIDYTFHGGVRAITSELLLGRKVKKADQKNDYDVIFVPTHTQMMNIDQEKIDAQVVPYIHDMLVLSSGFYNFIYNLKGRLWLKNTKKCDFIFSASDFTADDLVYRGGYTGEIQTVYQGAGFDTPEEIPDYENRDIDLIYVGEMINRKDTESLKQVAKKAEEKGLKMVAVNREELDLECEQKINVSNEELQKLYQRAKFHIHPAFIEGFGRGPVEAQSMGTVPIARDNDINNEILRDAFIQFKDPENAVELVKEMKASEWKEYSQKALKNSETYDFENTREQIKKKLVELAR